MKLKLGYLFLSFVLIYSCSSDDSNETDQEANQSETRSFSVIGTNDTQVYRYSYLEATSQNELLNLTELAAITPGFITLRETEESLSFYFFDRGAFSLVINNKDTQATNIYDRFFPTDSQRSLAWGINTNQDVFFGFFDTTGERNLSVMRVAPSGSIIEETFIDNNIERVSDPVLYNGKIYFSYWNRQEAYAFTFYDTINHSLGPKLSFTTPISFLVTSSGNIAIISQSSNTKISTYTADTLSLIEELPLEPTVAFPTGHLAQAAFKDPFLFYFLPNLQPAQLPLNPAILDINTQENTVLDLVTVIASLEQELGQAIVINLEVYEPKEAIFLFGYRVLGSNNQGGVVQLDTSGNLIAHIPLPFIPSYFLKN
ncbi:MAG: hypothetical protein AAGF77_00965 [Bacteroidota bacterium]